MIPLIIYLPKSFSQTLMRHLLSKIDLQLEHIYVVARIYTTKYCEKEDSKISESTDLRFKIHL